MFPSVRPRYLLLGAAVLISLVLTSCTSSPVVGEAWANFTVDGQFMYVSYKDVVFRIDTATPYQGQIDQRTVDWAAVAPDKSHMYAAPELTQDNHLFVGTFSRAVFEFSPLASPRNAALGTFKTPTLGDKVVAPVLVHGDTVYVGQGDVGLRAYDLATGAERAKFTSKFGVWAKPLLDAETNTLYVAALDHFLYALDPTTLAVKWSVDLGASIAEQPLLDNGILYLGTFGGKLYAIDTTSQKIVHTLDTDGWVWSTPVMNDGTLYFGDLVGMLYAVNANDFSVKWKVTDPDKTVGAIRGSVALANNNKGELMVIVGSESKFLRFYRASDGSYLYGNQAEEKILSDLAIIGDDVVFTTLNEDYLVVGYNINTGQRSWRVKKPTADDAQRLAQGAPPIMPTEAVTAEATQAVVPAQSTTATPVKTAEATASQ